MGGTGDRIKGAANEAAGKLKQAVGDVTGDNRLEAEGVIQSRKGELQSAVGKAKGAIKKAVDRG